MMHDTTLTSAGERFLIDLASDLAPICDGILAEANAGFALHMAAWDWDFADRGAQRALDAMKAIGSADHA